jgi:hypothetical protein
MIGSEGGYLSGFLDQQARKRFCDASTEIPDTTLTSDLLGGVSL